MKKLVALFMALILTLSAFPVSSAQIVVADAQDSGTVQTCATGPMRTFTLKTPDGISGHYTGKVSLHHVDDEGEITASSHMEFDFEGTSHTIEIQLPTSDTNMFGMELTLYEGPGVIPGEQYYRSSYGWFGSLGTNRVNFYYNNLTFTLPKTKEICGTLVSAQGDSISVPASSMSAFVYTARGEGGSYTVDISEDATFSITVPEFVSGSCYFSCYTPYENSNILFDCYQYCTVPGAAHSRTDETPEDSSYYIDLGADGISDLNLYVNTGYILTGSVELSEDAIMYNNYDSNLCNLNIYLTSENFSFTAYVAMTNDRTTWTYSAAVPKEAAEYTFSTVGRKQSGTITNVILSRTERGTVSVSGDCEFPTIILSPGKHVVSVQVTTPSPGLEAEGCLWIQTDENDSYSRTFYLGKGDTTTEILLTTSPDETAQSYRVIYLVGTSEGNSLTCNKLFYLGEDDTLTTEIKEAKYFPFDGTKPSLTLAGNSPYLGGKIYLPEQVDDDEFSIYVCDSLGGGTSFAVNAATIQTEEDGRQYIPYYKFNPDGNEGLKGSCFNLYFYLEDYGGSTLYHRGTDGCLAYLSPTLGFYYTPEEQSSYFPYTIPESGSLTLDFTLPTWHDGEDSAILQSKHGVTSFVEHTYTLSYPNDTQVALGIDPRTDVDLYINEVLWTAESLRDSSQTPYANLSDGVVTITVPAGEYADRHFGFAITSLTAADPSQTTTAPSVAAVYTGSGSSPSAVLSDLAAGEPVRVSLIGPNGFKGTLAAALYDADGRMIDLIFTQQESVPNGSLEGKLTLPLYFETTEGAASLTIMFLDHSNWTPQMNAKHISVYE